MRFLIKTAFWLGLVLLIIPFGAGHGSKDGEKQNLVNPVEAFLAAREAASDIAGMCGRKPEVCVVGKSAMHTIGVHAREGAKIAYRMLDEHFGDAANDGIDKGDLAKAVSAKPDTSIETGTVSSQN